MASGPSAIVSALTRMTGMPPSQATDPHADPRPDATEMVASGTLGWRRRIAFHVLVRASLMATPGRLSAAIAAAALLALSPAPARCSGVTLRQGAPLLVKGAGHGPASASG